MVTRFSKLIDYSPRQLYFFLRRKILSQERLQAFDDKHPCVFFLSTGRVGTQTLAALLSLADNIFAYHEPRPYLYGLSKAAYLYFGKRNSDRILKEAFLATREELFKYSLACHKGYVETSPQATFLGLIIREVVPKTKFIHLVRTPSDVVRSGMRRQWYAGHPYDKTRIKPRVDTDAARLWETYNTFQKNLWLWNETNRWILDFLADIPAHQKLLIRSEDVFGAHQETIEALFSFIGTGMPPEKKIANILKKKLNTQKVGDFPKTSAWTEEMHQALETMTGETARRLGYTV